MIAVTGRLLMVVLAVALIVLLFRMLIGKSRSPRPPPEPLPELPEELGYVLANPFEVTSPAVVEARAKRLPCRRCDGSVRVEDHQIEKVADELLRVVTTRCKQFGHEDRMYFRISGV